jgi:tetratricopeptide (TPR) repeat protein
MTDGVSTAETVIIDRMIDLNTQAERAVDRSDLVEAQRLLAEAQTIADTGLPAQHPARANLLVHLAQVDSLRHDLASARLHLAEARALRVALYGPTDSYTIAVDEQLADTLRDAGDLTAAEQLYTQIVAAQEATLGRTHQSVAATLNELGVLHHSRGDLAGALALHTRALAIRRSQFGRKHPLTAQTMLNLASVLRERGTPALARHYAERAVAIMIKTVGPDHPTTRQCIAILQTYPASQQSVWQRLWRRFWD